MVNKLSVTYELSVWIIKLSVENQNFKMNSKLCKSYKNR